LVPFWQSVEMMTHSSESDQTPSMENLADPHVPPNEQNYQ